MVSISSGIVPRIWFVQTDQAFVQRASFDLQEAGYKAIVASNTSISMRQFEQLQPAMVVFDQTQAGDLGFKLCREIRNSGNRVPVLILLERESLDDRIMCLEAGADDYLLKPYHSKDFLQRVQFYLQPRGTTQETLHFGDLVLDLTTRCAIRQGRNIDLTMKEFELLKYLMSNPDQVLSREQILENVWGYDFMGESNVIEVYIRYLRLKVENEGEKRLIQTVRGLGYVLRET